MFGKTLTTTAAIALMTTMAGAQIEIMLDDFSSSTMKQRNPLTLSEAETVFYEDIDARWATRDRDGDGGDYDIIGGQLRETDGDQGSVRAAAVFTVDLSAAGTGWAIEFDLISPTFNDFDVWLGIDDGNNTNDQPVYSARQNGNAPDDNAASWIHVINDGWFFGQTAPAGTHIVANFHDDADGPGTFNPQDVSAYNLLAFQIQSPGNNNVDLIIDNLKITNPVTGCSPGDTDGDGDIDTGDLTTSIQNFTGAGGSTTKTCEEGDTDDDGDVDTGDLTFSIQNFTGAQAANPNVPDLVYDPATGNVRIDADGADVISFSLQSGPFNAADFGELPAGLTDNIATQIGWTSFNLFSGLTGSANLGAILPAGLDLAQLEAALATASYGLALSGGGGGGRLDIIIPEPATMVLIGMGAVALVRRRRVGG